MCRVICCLCLAGAPVVTIYVGNLPPTVDEYSLMVPFSYFGPITSIQVTPVL